MILVATKHTSEFQFDLTGGHLALDLANTVSRRDDPQLRKDHLQSLPDLIAFARQSQVLSPRRAQELGARALSHPLEARRALTKAITLREAIYRTFSAIAQGEKPDSADLSTISEYATEALRHRKLESVNGGYHWSWTAGAGSPLDQLLWPVALAAADLLTSEELRSVRFCEASDCEWLFLDHSRNRSRRWCDMTTCGNRAKARRHYQRAHD
jgi:predicted RNA-binding Zn ribbon-like protein